MAKSATLRKGKNKGRKAGRPSGTSRYRPMTKDEALKAAVDALLTDIGEEAAAIIKAHSPAPPTVQAMCDYIKSLINGGGSVPPALSDPVIVLDMQAAFVVACEKRLVGKPLPGQQTDWYDGAVAEFRAQRMTSAA